MRRAQPLIKEYCAEVGIPYYETSISRSYREILSFLHSIGEPLRKRVPAGRPPYKADV
jgi:hypothetical protein